MGEDDIGFGLLGHVAAPHQLGLPRGLPARLRTAESGTLTHRMVEL
jgi:hypothetical protein